MSSKKEQGWFNYYRRPFLIFGALVFIGVWIWVPPVIALSEQVASGVQALGSIVLSIGMLGRLCSTLSIASHKNQFVVRTELYSLMRHPLYFFSSLLALGTGLMTARLDLTLLILVIFFTCFYPMMLAEEKYLEKILGTSYTNYMKITPRFIPNCGKWKARKNVPVNLRLIIRAFGEALISLSLIPLMTIIHYS